MVSFSILQQAFNDALEKESFIKSPRNLYDPVIYTLQLGGKRLRPALVLFACDLFGTNIRKALKPAIGIEIFHNFTLLHDDIMDQAPIRRGKPSVYRKWNTNIAILSGDTMFALAYKYMAAVEKNALPAVLDIFTKTAIEVCEGQQLDMDFESKKQITIDEYLNMIRLKTAVLLGCSLKVGAYCANASEKDAEALYHWGINMGLAFQLKDDYLDVYADSDKFGKQSGGDIISGKKTFLYLKAVEKSGAKEKETLIKLYNNTETDKNHKVSEVKTFFNNLNIRKETRQKIDYYAEKASGYLNKMGINSSKLDMFREISNMIINRNK